MALVKSIASRLQQATLTRGAWLSVAGVSGFAIATAVAAHVRIPLPFSPVPVTMQTFVVLLAGATLGSRSGAGSQVLYLALGACGAPIFTGATAFTAGYLLAFPVAAWAVGALREREEVWALPAGLALGTAVIYLLGGGWLALVVGLGAQKAILTGVLPFLAGDAMKLVAVWALTMPMRRGYERLTQH